MKQPGAVFYDAAYEQGEGHEQEKEHGYKHQGKDYCFFTHKIKNIFSYSFHRVMVALEHAAFDMLA